MRRRFHKRPDFRGHPEFHMRPELRKRRFGLRFMMTTFVFLIMLASMGIMGIATGILTRLGLIDPFAAGRSPVLPVLAMLAFSILLSTVMTALGGNRTLRPVREVIEATRAVAEGDFSVRLPTSNLPEFEHLNRSFNKMAEELGSIETLRSDFISTFSHEFKTPIVSIRGFAKLLKDKDLPEEEREEYIDIIISESERLTGLATNVLNLSKLETVTILADREHFRLDEQVRRVAAMMESRWKEKGLTVDLHMDKVSVYSDESLLQQVWINLFDNAIKYTGAGGHIAIALKRDGEGAVFTIEDNGCGMDEATMTHVFDKFYQADASRSSAGNGLGLSLVQRTVTLCGGDVRVESSPGQGSRFTVTLPVGQAAG